MSPILNTWIILSSFCLWSIIFRFKLLLFLQKVFPKLPLISKSSVNSFCYLIEALLFVTFFCVHFTDFIYYRLVFDILLWCIFDTYSFNYLLLFSLIIYFASALPFYRVIIFPSCLVFLNVIFLLPQVVCIFSRSNFFGLIFF